MTKSPRRLGLKFSLKQTPQRQPDDIVPIFQRWIQEHTVDGMLIDVIDYKHVPEGPGVLLIADEGDYAYDLGDGEIGLNYIRKRAIPDDLADALRLTFHHALKAAIALEADAPGDIVFDYASAKISFLDRMRYRNDPAVFDALRAELAEILSAIYGSPGSSPAPTKIRGASSPSNATYRQRMSMRTRWKNDWLKAGSPSSA